MKPWFLFLLVIALTACSGFQVQGVGSQPNSITAPELSDLGPAPELENQVWLNTDQPLRLTDLRGKVVLLEMWTFG
jgi:hypothetical protein